MADDQPNNNRQPSNPNLCGPRWAKGESGNPAGRPPNEGSITYWLKKLLAEPNGGGQPVSKFVAQKVIAQAKKGNLKAIAEVLDRTEGKATQPVDQNLTGDVTLTVRYADKTEADEPEL